MKKRLFLILCGIMCLFLLLCSCGEDDEGTSGGSSSSNNTQVSTPSVDSSNANSSTTQDSGTDNSGNNNQDNDEISTPETPCELNPAGHYWSRISINKKTAATGTVAVFGKCDLCGDQLHKVYTSLVDYNEWKDALSLAGLSSFTEVVGNEYTDYDKDGSISWRVDENGTYTADYFINSQDKNSSVYAQRFQGFLLQYNKFKYDSTSKTYVYWINESSYVELGFADGRLLSHSVCSLNDGKEEKSTTLYLNHQRINVEAPDFLAEKFDSALSMELLNSSNIGSSLAKGVYDELSKMSFNGNFEASLLENDKVSIYFYLDKGSKNPVTGEDYYNASVIICDGKITKASFGSTALEIQYK